MEKIIFSGQFFNVKDTLECGQTFRFLPYEKGYLIKSLDKCAYVYNECSNAVVECESADKEYFYNYFDLLRDYGKIVNSAINSGVEIIKKSATIGKGIRLLNQDKCETAFSFIISQNNNIPRIKSIIEKLCVLFGKKKTFLGQEYYSFPTNEQLAKAGLDQLKGVGLGYRAEYVKRFAQSLCEGLNLDDLNNLPTRILKKTLIGMHGIGPKVADCITLFGYKRSDSFPVDTWIEKVYREDLNGDLKNRDKISESLVNRFKDYSGYYQQYLFYYKRSIENKN